MPLTTDPFNARSKLRTSGGEFDYFSLPRLAEQRVGRVERLEFAGVAFDLVLACSAVHDNGWAMFGHPLTCSLLRARYLDE